MLLRLSHFRSESALCVAGLSFFLTFARLGAQDSAPKPDAPQPTAEEVAQKRVQDALALKFDRTAMLIVEARRTLNEKKFPADSRDQFRLQIVAGRWKDAGTFLELLPMEGRTKVYESILKDLDRAPKMEGPPNPAGPSPVTTLVAEDVADLADLAPKAIDWPQIKLLAALLKRIKSSGQSLQPFIARLDQGLNWLGGSDPVRRELAADLMIEVPETDAALRLLPPLQPGKETANFPVLEKHAKVTSWRGRNENHPEDDLEALRLNQILISAANCPPPIKDRAWRRMSDIIRWVPSDMAADIFKQYCATGDPEALLLLQNVAKQIGADAWNKAPLLRENNLRIASQAINALSAEQLKLPDVRVALNQLALAWTDEAEYARKRYVPPRKQANVFDEFGNPISVDGNNGQSGNPNEVKPIAMDELLRSAPVENWRGVMDVGLLPRVLALEADLHLKLEHDDSALPLIEQLAPLNGKEGARLADEFLRVWADVHDPHRVVNRRTFYGQSGPPGIPLTRALQRRNLAELAVVLNRLRVLSLSIDADRIVNAFVRAHSQAEVFETKSIEETFGDLTKIDLPLLSEVLQKMRYRLAVSWRKPAVQQQAKTQRTDAQIEAEVLRGYEVLAALTKQGLGREPDSWQFNLLQAATWYDLAEFLYGRKVDLSTYTALRDQAFAAFAHAAELYAKQLGNSMEANPMLYRHWLNANLGASDLALVTRQQDPDASQILRIRTALLALPGGAAQRHLDALAKAVAGSMDTIPAHMKPAYLKAALAVVSGSDEAGKIQQAVVYYSDLLKELELNVRIDGDATVGQSAFGVFLSLRHTAEIERESGGGFGKYLRNDGQGNFYYGYGGGGPPMDRRDNLEKHLRERLSDRFEILSITFHDDKVQSAGSGQAGWRETPLAYLLLKAKDAAVDRLPVLQLDMDFNDRQGTVVLPVASSVQLIDAKSEPVPPRPLSDLEITQVIDERKISEGRLSLEIKASGAGVLPKFETLFDFAPGEFKVEEQSDSGSSVLRLSNEGDALAARTDRAWLIKLVHTGKNQATTATFRFPKAKVTGAKETFKRYQDVDLVEVSPEVALTGLPLGHGGHLKYYWGGGALVALVGLFGFLRHRRSSAGSLPLAGAAYHLPSNLTPFSTLHLLRRMLDDPNLKLTDGERAELNQTVTTIESYYFTAGRNGAEPPDLSRTASAWVSRSSASSRQN